MCNNNSNKCPCPNHTYDTQGMFTDFSNGNTSINCCQQKIKFPQYTKLAYGHSTENDYDVNKISYDSPENGANAFEELTGTTMATARTRLLAPHSMCSTKDMKPANYSEGFVTRNGRTDFTTQLNTNIQTSTALAPISQYLSQQPGVCDKEGFCLSSWCDMSTCERACCVVGTVIGVIVFIIIIWMICKCCGGCCGSGCSDYSYNNMRSNRIL